MFRSYFKFSADYLKSEVYHNSLCANYLRGLHFVTTNEFFAINAVKSFNKHLFPFYFIGLFASCDLKKDLLHIAPFNQELNDVTCKLMKNNHSFQVFNRAGMGLFENVFKSNKDKIILC
ncbi:MAG: hypothetical protein EA362_11615 [Saprospirales bacterium]|nr:MAG: hypothetical protein EA362_11615 [Saprospirales bacterium]